MAFQENLIDASKSRLTKLKAFLEELEVQLALGKAEAKDTFQREKKNLSIFIEKERKEMQKVQLLSDEHKLNLLKAFEELESQLAISIPTGKQKFDANKKATLAKIYQLEHQLIQAYGDVSSSFREQLDRFKTVLDAFRIQLALGTKEDEKAIAQRKEALLKTVDELRLKLQKETVSEDRLEHFVHEVSESFNHMKKAFSDLFD